MPLSQFIFVLHKLLTHLFTFLCLAEFPRFDFVTAREDDKVDMRYMINMDYSADIHVNSLGRRIRTRLYFTSESHLHTLLNVLCYPPPNSQPSISSVLSERGLEIIHNARELCYLTQIVLRLFEDSQRDLGDPRRFRVEILFSPGATATPLHMHEMYREHDSTRFDTAPLQMIGKEDLTCKELEDYFDAAIMEGANDDEDEDDGGVDIDLSDAGMNNLAVVSNSQSEDIAQQLNLDGGKLDNSRAVTATLPLKAVAGKKIAIIEKKLSQVDSSNINIRGIMDNHDLKYLDNIKMEEDMRRGTNTIGGEEISYDIVENGLNENIMNRETINGDIQKEKRSDNEKNNAGNSTSNMNTKENSSNDDCKQRSAEESVSRKKFWTPVAAGSFLLAVGCLIFALNIGINETSRQRRRHPTSRRH